MYSSKIFVVTINIMNYAHFTLILFVSSGPTKLIYAFPLLAGWLL
jgi:hypothetical protein